MRLKMKKRVCRYDMDNPRHRHGHKYIKYKICHSTMMVVCIQQTLATFEFKFMKKLINSEAELKKSVANKFNLKT